MSIDTLSNMVSSVKNAVMAGRTYIEIPYSRQSEDVARAIKDQGFFESVKVFKEKDKFYKMLRINIAAEEGISKISEIKRISTPGHRIYKKSEGLGKTRGGFGYLIVSTSRGIMDGLSAKKKKLGGEVICEIH